MLSPQWGEFTLLAISIGSATSGLTRFIAVVPSYQIKTYDKTYQIRNKYSYRKNAFLTKKLYQMIWNIFLKGILF